MITPFAVLIVSRVRGRLRSRAARNTGAACRVRMGVVRSVLLMFHLFGLQLVGKSKFGSLFLELGKFVFVFGDLLEGGLDELALHVTDGDGELVDLKVTEDNFTLKEEHLSPKRVPLVKILLADFLQLIGGGIFKISFGSTTLSNDTETLLGFALLLLLQLLSCLLAEEGAQLLLALGGHESLLLSHLDVFVLTAKKLTNGPSSSYSVESRERSPH